MPQFPFETVETSPWRDAAAPLLAMVAHLAIAIGAIAIGARRLSS
jgi:hypothetical protein